MAGNSGSHLDAETKDMLASFVSEGLDSLDANEPIVDHLRLENNEESVNAIFRVFHTLKGLSGFFELDVIHHFTHEAETLLDIIRRQNLPQSEETITLIYELFDFLRGSLNLVSENFNDNDAKDSAEEYIKAIKEQIQIQTGTVEKKAPVKENIVDENFVIEINQQAPLDIVLEDIENTKVEEALDEFSLENFITPEMLGQYLTNAFELLEISEKNLLDLEKDTNNDEYVRTVFQSIHSLKGNSGFMGYGQVEDLSAELETILDSIRSKELEVYPELITLLLSNIEIIRNRLDEIAESKGKKDTQNSEEQVDKKEEIILDFKPQEDLKAEIEKEVEKPEQNANPENVGDKHIAEAIKQQDNKVEQIKNSVNINSSQKKDIRVETTKIDKLFDLVGELITIETMVTNNPDLAGMEFPNFVKATNMLNKITRELQEISLSIRMMPLESLFNKMKRLVRDVSLKMGKKVELSISGQETEMDKNVIDEIADPLVHILRDSIDHGVESPEDRLAKGKPEIGEVSLSARYEGNEILIVIEDDGKGLNKDTILKKAQSKGIQKAFAEKMSDKDIWNLIFEPGLSTAEKVTDISGRGVGMDVVKKNIEKLRGKVDIYSKQGSGSRFTMRIPLTLAIMEAMIIRIGSERFAVPILTIRESFKIKREQVYKTMDGLEMVKVRDEVLPVIRLHEYFEKHSHERNLEDGILIYIETRDKKVCLFVDDIVGQQQAVIKGISDFMGKLPGVMGCMILGDGDVGLILDIEGLIELSEQEMSQQV